jgi:phosphoribosyl 1,2-cyclic phosphate phosphodiesterase
MREQLLAAKCGHIDAALITHAHADQTHGIDDLRALTFATGKRIDFYADASTLEQLTNRFFYCFSTVEGTGYTPILSGHVVREPFTPFAIEGASGPLTVQAFWQQHGPIRSLGYRFGPVAYSSDVNALDDAAFEALAGVEVWVVDALRYRSHPTHANVETALEWIARVKPKRAILTNLHLDLDYETLKRELPENIEPAYDGMAFRVEV